MIFKMKKATRARPLLGPDADMKQPSGASYLTVLEALYDVINPSWYLEIGTQRGRSLRLARCNAIAIDPEFLIEGDVLGTKDSLHMFQSTSDTAFENPFFQSLGKAIDFSFLDGMHLFEFILRDFINTELHCHNKSVIAIHDCMPFNRVMAKRTWDRAETRQWTGDIWKIIPVLAQWRPDLTCTVLDAAPTGLLLVSNLDPDNRTLTEQFDAIVDSQMNVSLDSFGVDALYDIAKMTDTNACLSRCEKAKSLANFGL